MKALGLFITLMIGSLSYGAANVTFWNGDCLTNGWTWSHSSGVVNDYACYHDGCRTSGWIIGGSGRATYTQCMPGGCFQSDLSDW